LHASRVCRSGFASSFVGVSWILATSSFKYRNSGAEYQVPRFLSNQARAVVGASAWRFQVNTRIDQSERRKRAMPSNYSAASNVFRAGDVKLCSEQLARPVSPRPNRSPQTAGSKNSVSAVDVMSPPITTVASGR
jgi:hypothetical protein